MNTPTISHLTRRHASPNDTTTNNFNHKSLSSNGGKLFHPTTPPSRKHNISTKLLIAIAALSFLVGMALHTSVTMTVEKNVSGRVEAGFEPPSVMRGRRKELRKDTLNNLRDDNDSKNRRSNMQPRQKSQPQQQQPKSQQPNKRKQPRTIAIQLSPTNNLLTYQVPIPSIQFSSESFQPEEEGYYPIEPSWYQPNAAYFMDGVDLEQCEPMADWQLASFVDCNKFHELDLSKMRMINRG